MTGDQAVVVTEVAEAGEIVGVTAEMGVAVATPIHHDPMAVLVTSADVLGISNEIVRRAIVATGARGQAIWPVIARR